MNKSFKCSVLIPDSYGGDSEPLPVVYLLHGSSGTHLTLVSKTTSNAVDRLGFVAVCPWGGQSWWMDAPVANSAFESWIVSDVMPTVESTYRIRTDRSGRGIAGSSMGGFGAHYIGLRHKNLFSAVGSVFGAFDLTRQPDNWGKGLLFGPASNGDGGRIERSILQISHSLANGELLLIETVGTSDFTLQENRELHADLTKRGIEHVYVEMRGTDDKSSGHSYEFAWPAFDMIFDRFAAHFAGRDKIWKESVK